MKLNTKFNYPKSMRSIYNGSRHYEVGGEKLPSVTTILSLTKSQKDKDALNKWKKDVGFANATSMHAYVEAILLGRMNGELIEEVNLPKKMAETIVTNGINDHVDEIYGCEVVLHYPNLYAGTADAISNFDSKMAVLDFKQSNKPKQREWSSINEYFLQLCLYAMAHDKVYGTNIKTGVILMCTPNLLFQKFQIEGQEFENLKGEAMRRVDAYYELKNNS
jgi:genome maintenance exonuclease 1